MQLSAIINVVIGIVLIYTVLSLICTTVNEFIAALFQLRARSLSAAVVALIDEPALLTGFLSNGIIAASSAASSGGIPKASPLPTRSITGMKMPLIRSSYLDPKAVS